MNVLDLLRQKGIDPRLAATGSHGPEYWSPCPGCGGTDRFHVWPDEKGSGSYWCRQCGLWGDEVQFMVDFMGMAYPEAFEAAGRERPTDYRRPAPIRKKSEFTPAAIADPAAAWQEHARKLVDEAHAALMGPAGGKARAWLTARGINQESIDRFELGLVVGEKGNNCRWRSRKAWGLPEINRDNGRPKALWIPRGIVIPYIIHDQVQRIRIRRPNADLKTKQDVKYYVMPGSAMMPMCIGGGDQRVAVVIEAELDAILVAQDAGDLVVSIALGSSTARPDQLVWSILQRAMAILVALDFDAAGTKAWAWWPKQLPRSRRWPVPDGKDPGEAWAAGVDLRAWIAAGLPPACRLGPLRLTGDDQGAAKKDSDDQGSAETGPEKIAAGTGEDVSLDNIDVLYGLLCRNPIIRIRATARRTTLMYTSKAKEAVLQQVSRLVYFDPDCIDFLQGHPADVVSAGNFYPDDKE